MNPQLLLTNIQNENANYHSDDIKDNHFNNHEEKSSLLTISQAIYSPSLPIINFYRQRLLWRKTGVWIEDKMNNFESCTNNVYKSSAYRDLNNRWLTWLISGEYVRWEKSFISELVAELLLSHEIGRCNAEEGYQQAHDLFHTKGLILIEVAGNAVQNELFCLRLQFHTS